MSPNTTRAPSCAKSRASVAPWPRAPPLINATLPSSLPMAPSPLLHAIPHAPYLCRYSARVAPLPTQSTLHSSGPRQRETARHGGHPAVAAGTPGGTPALSIACLERTAHLCVTRPQAFLLSSGSHMRYTYA